MTHSFQKNRAWSACTRQVVAIVTNKKRQLKQLKRALLDKDKDPGLEIAAELCRCFMKKVIELIPAYQLRRRPTTTAPASRHSVP